jgi:hypothetical protein
VGVLLRMDQRVEAEREVDRIIRERGKRGAVIDQVTRGAAQCSPSTPFVPCYVEKRSLWCQRRGRHGEGGIPHPCGSAEKDGPPSMLLASDASRSADGRPLSDAHMGGRCGSTRPAQA